MGLAFERDGELFDTVAESRVAQRSLHALIFSSGPGDPHPVRLRAAQPRLCQLDAFDFCRANGGHVDV